MTPTQTPANAPAQPRKGRTNPKRDLLIEVAAELFRKEGIHATGIDRILEVSGVAKMTLYNHFGNKDGLVVAVVDHTSRGIVDQYQAWADESGDPFEQIELLFTRLATSFEDPAFCGCLIQGAAAEFSDPDHPVAHAVLEHHARVRAFLETITERFGCTDSAGIAARIAILLSGATCTARLTRDRTVAEEALRAAEILLERACG